MNIKPESKTFINLAKFFIPFIIGLGVVGSVSFLVINLRIFFPTFR